MYVCMYLFFLKVFSCCLFGKLFEAYALHVQLAVASEEVHCDGVFVLVNLGRLPLCWVVRLLWAVWLGFMACSPESGGALMESLRGIRL